MIGVDYICSLLLVDYVEHFQAILSQELVISVYQHNNICLFAVLPYCFIDVRNCCHLKVVS